MQFSNLRGISSRPKSVRLGSALMLGLLFFMAFSRISPVLGSTISTSCSTRILHAGVLSATANVNQALANQTAAPVVATYTTSESLTFDSVFYYLHWSPNCSVSIQNVIVAYYMKTSNGTISVLEMFENPSLTTVIQTSILPWIVHSAPDYVGYEYYEAHGFLFNLADWAVPSLAGPGYSNDSTNLCNDSYYNSECDFSFWVGQTASHADSYIAQAGADSYCTGTCSSSSYSYDDWWEFYIQSDAPYYGTFGSCSAGSGNSVSAEVDDLSMQKYSASIYNYADSTICDNNSPSNFSMGTAHYSDFVGETPPGTAGYDALPDFNTLSVSGAEYEDTSSNLYYASSSWSYLDLLTFPYTPSTTCQGSSYDWNVCPSVPNSSTGDFTENWVTDYGYSDYDER